MTCVGAAVNKVMNTSAPCMHCNRIGDNFVTFSLDLSPGPGDVYQ